jgi:hypothetical protein
MTQGQEPNVDEWIGDFFKEAEEEDDRSPATPEYIAELTVNCIRNTSDYAWVESVIANSIRQAMRNAYEDAIRALRVLGESEARPIAARAIRDRMP